MTDDISKVVRDIRYAAGSCYAITPAELDAWADRLESATTPAEVGPLLDLIGKYWDLAYAEGVQRRSHDTKTGEAQRTLQAIETGVATLARQLAEAKAEIAAHERNDIAATDLIHSFLQRLEQAESQLAAATRRLGEVEAFIPENGYVAVAWVRDGDVCCIDPTDDPTEMMDEGWLPAALIPPSMPFALSVTKEPTK